MMAPVSMKPGASIVGVAPEMAFGLVIISGVFWARGVPLVVTDCTDGAHMPGSLHFVGSAVDVRLPSRFTADADIDSLVVADLRAALGEEWDVVSESDHLHIEHDPKTHKGTHA